MKARLAQLLYLARCYALFARRGRATRITAPLTRVGVMQLSKLGDMVCTTPVFRALKHAYPDVQVVVVGNAINKALLAGHPDVDSYAVWRSAPLASLRLDAVVLTSPSAEALAAAYLAGVPCVIAPRIENGTSPYETRVYKLLRALCLSVPHRMGHYAPQEYLNMLRPLGIDTTDTRKELAVAPEARQRADALLAPHTQPLKIAIAPGAGNKIKEWPPEYFHALAAQLVDAYRALIVLVGGPDDRPLATIVKDGLPGEHVLDTTGELSLEELKALISRMDLFVSADTGPIYVAEAFGVPTVDIVGPVDEREQPPHAPPMHVVVAPERKRPELYVMDARSYDAREARRQAESVQPAQVLEAIAGVLRA